MNKSIIRDLVKSHINKTVLVNESIEVEGSASIEPVIKDVVSKCLIATVGIHLEHWKTVNEAKHVALGDFYTSLNTQLDSLAEMAMGVGINIRYDFSFGYTFSTDMEFVELLSSLRDVITEALQNTTEAKFQSINDCLVAIQKSIDTLSYKLELS
jgi:hypothetical protein